MEPLAAIETAFDELEHVIDALRCFAPEETNLNHALRGLEHEHRIGRGRRLGLATCARRRRQKH